MTSTTTPPSLPAPPTSHETAHRSTDALLGWLLLAHLGPALALAPLHGTWTTALGVALPVSLGTFLLTRLRPGALSTRLVVAAALMVCSAVFIHQTHGLVEAHLHVFVALALLTSYRDWRVPVGAAAVIAVHHLLFSVLQHSGRPVWVVSNDDGIGIIAARAGFVVLETAVLVHLAMQMRRSDSIAQQLLDAADRLAAGELEVLVRGDGAPASLNRVATMLRAFEAETGAFAQRVCDGRGQDRQEQARGGSTLLRGVFATMMQRFDDAAVAADAVRESARLDAERAHAFLDELRLVATALREGDLARRMSSGLHEGQYADVARTLDEALDQLAATLTDVASASTEIDGTTARLTGSSAELAAGTAAQAASLEQVAASLQELGAVATRSADGTVQACSLAEQAQGSTAVGVSEMRRLAEAVSAIRASAGETRKVLRTIDEIAFQTNLLALNAAVEAARAGDAGRGFAVVAEEVRVLALRSAEAARRTAALVDESVRHTDAGVALTNAVADRLVEIDGRVSQVTGVVSGIAAASAQQRQGVEELDAAVEQMTAEMRRTTSGSEASAADAAELAEQAAALSATVARFSLGAHTGAPRTHAAAAAERGGPIVPEAPAPGTVPGTFRPERRRSVFFDN